MGLGGVFPFNDLFTFVTSTVILFILNDTRAYTVSFYLSPESLSNMSLKSNLMVEVAEPVRSSGNKVTIVGIGQVGMACAFSILTQSVSSEVVLVDVMADKLQGEMLDLQHGSAFMKNASINASTGE